jgi:hypothetical protein
MFRICSRITRMIEFRDRIRFVLEMMAHEKTTSMNVDVEYVASQWGRRPRTGGVGIGHLAHDEQSLVKRHVLRPDF